jgi:prolyl oligopeptidase
VIDEFLWLEEVESPEAYQWVDERNAEALAALAGGVRFAQLREEIRGVLDDDRRIPYPRVRGEYLYDFWQDAEHPRGLWRRTTWAGYRAAEPDWDVLIDVDALGAAEGETWVWGGAYDLPPAYERFLISLSRGGSDAHVMREFDIAARAFVDLADGGYALPEAKSGIEWIDRDRVFVATDFGPGSLTSSGYPRIVKLWQRGTPLDEAEPVFEGRESDVVVGASFDPTPGYERAFVVRWLDNIRRDSWLRADDGQLIPVPVPDDADWSVHREWTVIVPRTEWAGHPPGTMLAIRFDALMAGGRDFTVLFAPTANSALVSWDWTRDHLLLDVMTDVRNRLEVLTPGDDGWARAPLPVGPDDGTPEVVDTNPLVDNEYLVTSNGFLQPAVLSHGRIGGDAEVLKEAPAFFDSAAMTVRQLFATSDDGTKVPYFLVGQEREGPAPTLLWGYGGFRHSILPAYDGVTGRVWLVRGGLYAVANIRGGGEYGPEWHQAARREKRHKAYEDFAAIAADLVNRGVTTPALLGAEGRSNGGLLMGVMLTRYPHLFGAIVASVPLMDMRRFHKMLAGASWMGEYGDPDNPDDWAFIREYSPYHNVRRDTAYPPVLITTSTRDDRVHPGHARKMAAWLRACGHDVTYYENREGGHAGAADHEQEAFMTALATEFLWRRLTGAPA